MIDKVNNITSGSTQSKRSIDENKVNKSSGDNKVTVNKNNSSNTENIKISQELGVANLSKEPSLDLDKVSAIKNALSRGDYPIDLEKVADALLQAYKDIK
ncbi:MAG: flagellar biosynthesis anti-sigma factor FlgM [Alphaproteobacteria bacterium TMED93]|nr:MAG: flagellar biosynthesis anti-sigma factor FlgM [Alphaproteobacteria bacterium TMED93]|tara:strand:+ start:152 stop:451 length:300 start_codon:yes stop_codon:yes gene_type:complete